MSKLEGAASRFALIVHLVRCAAGDVTLGNPIDAESIGIAVCLIQWFVHEIKRVYAVLAETDGDRENRQIVELIQRNGGEITVRQLMRASREFRNSADDATAALQGLVDSGEGLWIASKPGSQGGQPTKAFRLAVSTADSGDGDITPGHDTASGGSVTVTAVTGPADDDWGVI